MAICSKDNPKIKLCKKLMTSKKARDEHKMFVIEGMRICVDTAMEAAEGNLEIAAFFYTSSSLLKYENSLDLHYFDLIDENLKYEISDEIASKLSDEGNSQGVFIIAKKLDKPFDESEVSSNGKYLVLDNLQDPGNLGTLLRTADAVGVDGVVVADNCVDLYNPKVVRSTMGSIPRLNIYVEKDFSRVCEVFRKKGVQTLATVINGGTSITQFDFSKPCAIIIGNEGKGMPDEHVSLCSDRVTIRMNGNMDSLNAATAGTIFLWEMTRTDKE